ncbi:MAG: phosphoserine phosphatase SerB [Lentisphaeria bacterium]|nr:phosphoserine phosphatase SerB [Lentisphaeria bacterium]
MQIYRLKITGQNTKNFIPYVMSNLIPHDTHILDIGMNVLHQRAYVALLIQAEESLSIDIFRAKIQDKVEDPSFQIDIESTTLEDYENWVVRQGEPRHIITLLGQKLTAEHYGQVTAIANKYHVRIERINRMSGRVSLRGPSQPPYTCVEIAVKGQATNEQAFREELLILSSLNNEIDIAVQKDDIFRKHRRLICFDMDSTLIKAEVIDELAKRHGVGDEVAAVTAAAMRGELDFNQSFRQRVSKLEGLSEEVLKDIAVNLPLMDGVEKLTSTLNKLGFKTAILSGGFTYFGHYLQNKLGFDYVHANILDIENGVCTGKVKGTIVNGEMKAQFLKEIAEKEGLNLAETVAVGDGANDLPMIKLAGLGVAYHAKPIVRASANNSISQAGLDGLLYLLGINDREISTI